jgi:hypothetical protein
VSPKPEASPGRVREDERVSIIPVIPSPGRIGPVIPTPTVEWRGVIGAVGAIGIIRDNQEVVVVVGVTGIVVARIRSCARAINVAVIGIAAGRIDGGGRCRGRVLGNVLIDHAPSFDQRVDELLRDSLVVEVNQVARGGGGEP